MGPLVQQEKKLSSSLSGQLPVSYQTIVPLPPFRYSTVFEGKHLLLQKGLALHQLSCVELVGMELETMLNMLFLQQDETIRLFAPIFKACFVNRQLPSSLEVYTGQLYKLWKKNLKLLFTVVADNPGSAELQKDLYAHYEELQKALQDSSEDLEILKTFIPYYLQRPILLKEKDLSFLSGLGERLGIQFQLWNNSSGNLTQGESFGSRDCERVIHILRDRNNLFHLVPIPFQGKGKSSVKEREPDRDKGKEKEKEEAETIEAVALEKEKNKENNSSSSADDLPSLEDDYMED